MPVHLVAMALLTLYIACLGTIAISIVVKGIQLYTQRRSAASQEGQRRA